MAVSIPEYPTYIILFLSSRRIGGARVDGFLTAGEAGCAFDGRRDV